jgi:hypothetical protein
MIVVWAGYPLSVNAVPTPEAFALGVNLLLWQTNLREMAKMLGIRLSSKFGYSCRV